MKLLIVRHGDPDYSIDSLTEKGWREAELLKARLTRLDIAAFYTSPLGRAKDTARPTLEALHRTAGTLPWLREFSGTVANPFSEERRVPWNLMPQFWTKQPQFFEKDGWRASPFMSTGDAVSVYDRTAAGLYALLARHGYERDGMIFRCQKSTEETICLFCHFGIGMCMLSILMGVPLPVMWQGFFMPTSSVTTLVTEERVKGEAFLKCVQLGDTSHLYAGGEPVSRSGLFPETYQAR